MDKQLWTRQNPYSVSVFMPGPQGERQRGQLTFRAAANYAASIIRDAVAGNERGADLPRITVFDTGIEAVQLQGFDLEHYRPVIADADVYDANSPERRGEWQYIIAACREAGADGKAYARAVEG